MLQVAAATNCKHHYGVEKADIPAKYAEVSSSGDVLVPPDPRGWGGSRVGSLGASWSGTHIWAPLGVFLSLWMLQPHCPQGGVSGVTAMPAPT